MKTTQTPTWSAESQVLHTEYPAPDAHRSLAMPIYHAAAAEFPSAEAMEDAFVGRTHDFAYSRIMNPTVQHFENEVKVVSGASDVVALSSGMAAISNTLITLAWQGCNVVTSAHLFGNTYSLLASTLAAYGVETRFCDLTDPKQVEQAVDENTCALFLEIITNPQLEVADLKALSTICRRHGFPLVADTTIIPFTVFHAAEFGVDIEVVSSTKYLSGGATSLGGLILDYATFDCSRSKKLAALAIEHGNRAFSVKLRNEIMKNLGAYMTPHAAYMQTLGLETLSVRYERVSKSCNELAHRLRSLPAIERVNYTGLEENSFHTLSARQFGPNPGAMMTIDLHSREACYRFLNRLQLIRRATNLFDNKSLAIHPASTIFGTFSEEQRRSMDVSDKTIRLSIGLEAVEDLFNDIHQALEE